MTIIKLHIKTKYLPLLKKKKWCLNQSLNKCVINKWGWDAWKIVNMYIYSNVYGTNCIVVDQLEDVLYYWRDNKTN